MPKNWIWNHIGQFHILLVCRYLLIILSLSFSLYCCCVLWHVILIIVGIHWRYVWLWLQNCGSTSHCEGGSKMALWPKIAWGKILKCHKFKMTISQNYCCYNLRLLTHQQERSIKWHTDPCITGTNPTIVDGVKNGTDGRRMLMTFYSCIMTCIGAYIILIIIILIVHFTYIELDTVPKLLFFCSMSHSLAINLYDCCNLTTCRCHKRGISRS